MKPFVASSSSRLSCDIGSSNGSNNVEPSETGSRSNDSSDSAGDALCTLIRQNPSEFAATRGGGIRLAMGRTQAMLLTWAQLVQDIGYH